MYYDLCGWHWYFGINGSSYSHSWRIDGDDNNWDDILGAFEISLSGIWKYGMLIRIYSIKDLSDKNNLSYIL